MTILKDFLSTFRKKEEKPIQRYETEHGEQMQVDWVVLRRGANLLSAFIGVLGHSRKSYIEFTQSEDELTKGKVELFGGYLKHNFYYPLITKEGESLSLGKLNYEAKK